LRRYIITLQDEIARQDEMLEQQAELLRQSISKSEHEKLMELQKREYESKLSDRPPRVHNERGAGRKPKVTDKVKARVLELHAEGNSQLETARIISDEFDVALSRSTVGNIIRSTVHPPEVAPQTTKP